MAGARVLVTGGSSGIGAATAHAMAAHGAEVTITGRDPARLAAVAARTGGRAVLCDLLAGGGPADLVAAAGPVDVLVAAAGAGWAGAFTAMPPEGIDRLVRLNLTVPMLLTRLLLPGMIAAGRGHVVLISSIAGAVGVPGEAAYSAAKAGLVMFAEALRHELRTPGAPGVSVVLPGAVATPFFTRRGTPYTRRHPAPVPPERVARAVVAAVETSRPESYVPAWLAFPARLRGAAPAVYRLPARRAGGSA
nr:SDR family NAD(P)-dependent oxidoreductase [Sphaerisporangium rubeum]